MALNVRQHQNKFMILQFQRFLPVSLCSRAKMAKQKQYYNGQGTTSCDASFPRTNREQIDPPQKGHDRTIPASATLRF